MAKELISNMVEGLTYDVASHGDYHAFSFKEKYFFYDIEKMQVYQIEEGLYYKLISNRKSDFFDQFIDALSQNNKDIPARLTVTQEVEPLSSISLNVAQVCNLSCVYCYGVDGEYGTKGKMNEETAFNSVDFLIKESGNLPEISIIFFGGEPLLNFPLIKKVVDYSNLKAKENNKRIYFSITTNGTLFNDEVNQYLNENNFSVTVSFDGDAEIQDKNRPFRGGKGSYAETKPKVEKFLKSRDGRAMGRATVTNHSVDLENLKTKLKDIGFNSVAATKATVSNYALENRDIERVSREQFEIILSTAQKDADDIFSAIKSKSNLSSYKSHPMFTFLSQLKKRNKRVNACGVGRTFLGVSITGDLYPCHRFVGNEKFHLGNIADHNAKDRLSYNQSLTITNETCSKCWAKYYCGGGGCIHDNEVTKGDINNINVEHCSNLKNSLKHAMYIYSILTDEDKEII